MHDRLPENPLTVLAKIWRVGERIAVALASLLVIGTVGYVSLHALALA
ncbi:MAG: hypothetical protein IRZ10_07145 [Thermoflavifilum sp.]|nr:hypothetical protein [Thermoflavifilum sp.]MCL6514183.1 hypothetical protein [Alicyclobacillus sp.]